MFHQSAIEVQESTPCTTLIKENFTRISLTLNDGFSPKANPTLNKSSCYIFLVLPSFVITQDGPPAVYQSAEGDALLALNADFKHYFLVRNWTGLPCYFLNKPPSRWYGIQCLNGRVTGILLENMGLTGEVNVHALVDLTELSSLSFKNNMISGNLMDFTFNTKLRSLDLSDNLFDGPVSNSLLGLDVLESLQLQRNILTGPIPEFNQQSLAEFNVSDNNLSGKIPRTSFLQSCNSSSFAGNPGLCGLPTLKTCGSAYSEPATANNNKNKTIAGASLISIFVVLDIIGLVIVVLLFYVYYKKAKKNKTETKEIKLEEQENEKRNDKIGHGASRPAARGDGRKLTFLDGVEHFELQDLLKASAEGLGKGNFGNVYKAKLENGPEVVVKRLRDLRPLTDDEFAKQMRLIADLKHPNLLPPLAYHFSKEEKLMIHKFLANGNLFNRLFGGRGINRIPFKWNSRLSVAQTVARAMEYLHLNSKVQNAIPHGNLKSSNVLLDANEMAIVSDYGLASLIALPISAQRMSSYKCPEYQTRKRISKKADIWCYGSLLLELLTGKISTYSAPQGINGVDLGSWIHKAVREEWTAEIFDLEISRQRNAGDGMLRLLQVALRCCDKSPEKRPDMEQVVREVEEIRICESDYDSDFSFEQSVSA
ncbi:hypothetical protein IFM89_021988 [Coptis chinensis]|uniref:Protein kinase domain-containing protein n=1 Tax=Coptis chinensis TaxID=261450 RepID=A0A835I6U5_9MAGN|nr:hypothetical protein IFM89_021988 [Coptis chinensis]